MTEPTSDSPADSPAAFPRWLKWALLGALAVLILGYGAIFLYANVINDSPDEFDETDLDAALAVDEPAGEPPTDVRPTVAPATDAPSATTSSDVSTEPVATDAPGGPENQIWSTTDESQVGYRVKEILFGVDAEGVGRTNQVTGTFVIEGTQVVSGEFVVDVATIESDDRRRDGQFRGRIMSTDEYPEATFTLAEPIELGTEPADGVDVATTATGELTLRGVANPVTFDVTAQQQNGRVGVLGAIPIVFADYSIANPSIAGITTEDNGLLEFVLVFEPA
ncbi:MAG TPA: YceI family protein [Ilumatobacter sp.]|nr:YceI family protein [Ilumatobacter sp.]